MAKTRPSNTRFDLGQWCDFVRGVADPDVEQTMREQLAADSPGARSRRHVELLGLVVATARRDQELEIPEYAVRGAKAIGSLRRPHQLPSLAESIIRHIPFSVTFDSLLQPAPVGTRDIHSANRQLSFDAEDYSVDVLLAHETDPPSTVVVGQLLCRNGGVRPVPEVPVFIVSEGQIVGRSLTGKFGEFHADGLPTEAMKLCLLVSEAERIELPLDKEQVRSMSDR